MCPSRSEVEEVDRNKKKKEQQQAGAATREKN
jgi:hypothetical protein